MEYIASTCCYSASYFNIKLFFFSHSILHGKFSLGLCAKDHFGGTLANWLLGNFQATCLSLLTLSYHFTSFYDICLQHRGRGVLKSSPSAEIRNFVATF